MAQLCELSKDQLINFQANASPTQVVIIKFGAEWCGPCQKIKNFCDECFRKLPKSITCVDIDIDEHIELYVALKSKKMVNGVPALLAYYGGARDHWFIPNDSVLGGDVKLITDFFNRCIIQASK
jgi:thiol-disulfide isomerase/thioredoxin